MASELREKDDKVQRVTFLHCLGPGVQTIFRTMPGEHKKLEDVELALQNYFAPKNNRGIHKIQVPIQGTEARRADRWALIKSGSDWINKTWIGLSPIDKARTGSKKIEST